MSQQTKAYVCNVDENACGWAGVDENVNEQVRLFLSCPNCGEPVDAQRIESEKSSELEEEEIKRIIEET
jgi:transcription initiation factor IIE alpha subunit